MPLYNPPVASGPAPVGVTGDQTIAGVKTFSSAPVLAAGATVDSAGVITWGDANLYRNGTLTLKTDGAFVAPLMVASALFGAANNTGPYIDVAATAIGVKNRTSASNVPLLVQGMAGQTGDLQDWRDGSGNLVVSITSTGQLTAGTGLMQGSLTVGRATVQGGIAAHVVAPDVNTYPLVVQGIAGQTTDLVRIWNSAGMQVGVTSAGVLQANAGLIMGSDTNLYRSAANTLKTDDALVVTGLLTALDNLQIQGVLYANSHAAVGGNLAIAGNIGFYGSASVAKPTVTGSRGGNAALASLLTALASQGLITDSSTA